MPTPSKNSRYPNFNQTHFTAGDEEQFESRRNRTNKFTDTLPSPTIPYTTEFAHQIRWKGYQAISPIDVTRTFRYIFHKFKKGIFVQILDNQLMVFLPFSKHNFINEWSDRVLPHPRWNCGSGNEWYNLFRFVTEKSGYRFSVKSVHAHTEKWYANNGLIRYEYPIHEGDTGVSIIWEMLTELCETRTIPDMEFFINRRDFPILRMDGNEAYTALFGEGMNMTRLVSHSYDKYCPILSMCTSSQYADIPMVNTNDWSVDALPLSNWDSKKPIAVFRGSSTGLGTTKETNMRLKVAYLSQEDKRDRDGLPFLDAGITKWNFRPRKRAEDKYIDTIRDYSVPLIPPLTPIEQSTFKYIIHIDGHVCAFRLSRELSYGSVLLITRSNYSLWFSHLLMPYVHYIPVKEDLSDLIDRVKWCKGNDEKCREIARNAYLFYEQYLTRDGLLNYMQTLLVRIKNSSGTWRYRTPFILDEMASLEATKLASLDKFIRSPRDDSEYTSLDVVKISLPSTRSFTRMQAMRLILSKSDNLLNSCQKVLLSSGNKKHDFFSIQIDNVHLLGKGGYTQHECFMGLFVVNRLLEYIPNFSYTYDITFGLDEPKVIYTEYFPGTITLTQYIMSDNFTLDNYFDILLQIGLILYESQQRIGFVHYDLTPRNILLDFNPSVIHYYCDQVRSIVWHSIINPILIDYEWSHAIVDGLHHGRINCFTLDFIHDILTILVSSLADIFRYRTLSKRDMARIFLLTSFFDDTEFSGGKKFSTISELKIFLGNTKKFANILSAPKGRLAQKTALDFVYFMQDKFDYILEFSSAVCFQMRDGSVGEMLNITCPFPILVVNLPYDLLTSEQCLLLYVKIKAWYNNDYQNEFTHYLTLIEQQLAKVDNLQVPILTSYEHLSEGLCPRSNLSVDDFDGKLESEHRFANESTVIDWFYQRNLRIDFLRCCTDKYYWMNRWKNYFTKLQHQCIANILIHYNK